MKAQQTSTVDHVVQDKAQQRTRAITASVARDHKTQLCPCLCSMQSLQGWSIAALSRGASLRTYCLPGSAARPAQALLPSPCVLPDSAGAPRRPTGHRRSRGGQVERSCQKVTRPALSDDTSGVPCGLQAVHSTLAAPDASLSVRTTGPARSACCAPPPTAPPVFSPNEGLVQQECVHPLVQVRRAVQSMLAWAAASPSVRTTDLTRSPAACRRPRPRQPQPTNGPVRATMLKAIRLSLWAVHSMLALPVASSSARHRAGALCQASPLAALPAVPARPPQPGVEPACRPLGMTASTMHCTGGSLGVRSTAVAYMASACTRLRTTPPAFNPLTALRARPVPLTG